MNVKLPMMEKADTFWVLMASMLVISGGFIYLFKRKKWM
jgi:LPXTG-motif cell wall-anchored protein